MKDYVTDLNSCMRHFSILNILSKLGLLEYNMRLEIESRVVEKTFLSE